MPLYFSLQKLLIVLGCESFCRVLLVCSPGKRWINALVEEAILLMRYYSRLYSLDGVM